MRTSILVAVMLLLAAPGTVLSQTTGTITGVVLSETDRPLSGVEVTLADAPQGTVTGTNGRFRITGVPVGERTVRAKILGYGTHEETVTVIGGETVEVTFRLQPQALELERVVVTGYGTQVKRELSGAVASIDGEDLLTPAAPTVTVGTSLQGKAAGVAVVTNSGIPGAGASVRVRGTNSIGTNSEPLYVIDGVPATQGTTSDDPTQNPLNTINPNDIASIDILKDASATAIYGARGANGVILITTRRGRPGTDQFRLESSYGVQTISKTIDVLNARQYRELRNEALTNVGSPAEYSELDVESYDYPERLLRGSAPQQNHSLSFTGGDEKTRYLISTNYMTQDGIVWGTGFERYSGRINLDRDISDRFRAGTSLSFARSKLDLSEVETGELAGNSRGMIAAMAFDPATAPTNAEGEWVQQATLGEFMINPVATVSELVNRRNETRFLWNLFGEFDILDNLQFRSSVGGTLFDYFNPRYAPRTIYQGSAGNGVANIWQGRETELLNENLLSFRAQGVGPGDLSMLGGFTYQTNDSDGTSMGAEDFLVDATLWNNIGAGANNVTVGSYASEWTLLSWLARANYNVMNRYMFTVTGRYDGSSKFGAENKWAFFPSGSAAWILSEEEFMEDQTLFDELKLRLSYGITGNQPILTYASLAGLATTEASIGDTRTVVFVPGGRAANPDLQWETTRQFNAGVDVGMLNNRLTVSLDVYTGETEDLLLLVPLPFTSGFQEQLQNVGSIENRGVELEIQTVNLETANLSWRSSFNLAANRNEVLSLGTGQERLLIGEGDTRGWSWAVGGTSHVVQPGEPLGSFFGYQVDGLFQQGDTCNLTNPRPFVDCIPGELRFVDTNGDGEITPDDRTVIGNAEPTFYGGFSNAFTYGPFSVDAFINFSYGNEVINAPNVFAMSATGQLNERVEVLDRWTPDNTDTDIPRANAQRRAVLHSNLVEDGSFLRLQSLTLGYDLPAGIVPGTSQARVYLTGQNLITLTGYSGFDPEVNSLGGDPRTRGVDIGAYPRARTYNFGVSVTF